MPRAPIPQSVSRWPARSTPTGRGARRRWVCQRHCCPAGNCRQPEAESPLRWCPLAASHWRYLAGNGPFAGGEQEAVLPSGSHLLPRAVPPFLPPRSGRNWPQMSAPVGRACRKAAKQAFRNHLQGKTFGCTWPLLSAFDSNEAAGTRTPDLRIKSPLRPGGRVSGSGG